jgi:O-antigen ligase
MVAPRPQPLRKLWPVVLPLAMIVSTEYKVRFRPLGQALSGALDLTIFIELGVYGLAGAFVVYYFARPPRVRQIEPVLFALWAYTGVTVLSALYSVYPLQAMARAVQLLVIAAVAQAIASRGTRADMYRLGQAYIVLIAVSVVHGFIWKFPAFSYLQAGRFRWLAVHPVIAGAMLGIAFTLSVGFTAIRRPSALPLLPRWSTAGIAGMTGVALVMTKTRGSIFGGLVAALIIGLLSRPRSRRGHAIVGFTAFAAMIVIAAGTVILQYLQRGEDTQDLETLSNRTVLWSVAWRDFLERPLFGYGFTASRGIFYDEVGLGGAHNAAINVMIDVGIVGLIAWVGFLACTSVAARRAYVRASTRADAIIVIGILACLFVNSLTTEGLGSGVSVSAMWLYLTAAWVVVLKRDVAHRDIRRDDARAFATPAFVR